MILLWLTFFLILLKQTKSYLNNISSIENIPNIYNKDFENVFNAFVIKFNKTYTEKDVQQRKYYLNKSLNDIERNNKLYEKGVVSHRLGVNKLADLSPEEYHTILNTFSGSKRLGIVEQYDEKGLTSYIEPTQPLPLNFDWRDRQVVTPVKDQGMCGSCWAFAGIATIESAYAIQHNLTNNELIEFSVQQMIDCTNSYPYNSYGCNGGLVYDVFKYASHYSVVKASDYPFMNFNNTYPMTCKNTFGLTKTKLKDYFTLKTNSSDSVIMNTIYSRGPVVVQINVNKDFRFYSEGIITSIGNRDVFKGRYLHDIAVVGWGTSSGIDYWICKNSFGDYWGENGYVRLKRGINIMGFNTLVLYPYNMNTISNINSFGLSKNFNIFCPFILLIIQVNIVLSLRYSLCY